ncbi:MAG: DNA polymerase/3'-5' exonuclease PolX [Chloroflexi bacterium]|nr:DNA polymerase/3'-5' exonuclease PolX [Chloroflexota bacterium]
MPSVCLIRPYYTHSALKEAEVGPMVSNEQVAEVLEQIGVLLELKGEAGFRVRAYQKAADAIRHWSEPVAVVATRGELQTIPGVGKAIADKVSEVVTTGHLIYLAELRAEFPAGMFALLDVPGLGGKTALRLARELGVETREELEEAARAGRLRSLGGFGAKKEEAILHSLEAMRRKGGRFPIAQTWPIAAEAARLLRESDLAEHIDVAGSLRRFEETIGDVDIIATARDSAALTARFVTLPFVTEVIAHGPVRATVRTSDGLQVDFKVVEPRDYGSLLQHFTGSKTHNIRLREYAQRRQLKVSEYGVVDERNGEETHFTTEEALYARLGLAYIPPELRQGLDEIERAQHGPLPRLVQRSDLWGDLHAHTSESDGRNTLEEMVVAAQSAGLHYLAICDHSVGRAVARGLTPERLQQQRVAIDAMNRTVGPNFRVIAGSEVDIRADGRLDYPDGVLAGLEIVVASVHSAMQQDRATATARVLAAIEHPAVTIIGHPTARIIGRREPIALDMDTVIAAAVRTGTALEINGGLERLDLSAEHARKAREAGAMLVISTDAHEQASFGNLDFGAAVARRAGCGPEHVLNTRSAAEVLAFARAKRARITGQ